MNFKQLWRIGFALVAIGGVIAVSGFALTGGNPQAYQHHQEAWYRTIHFD